jgi:AAHS family 4-hydroxybenzoate transporter-like MFS transporter
MQFLVLKKRKLDKVAYRLKTKRIDPTLNITADTQFVVHEKRSRGARAAIVYGWPRQDDDFVVGH